MAKALYFLVTFFEAGLSVFGIRAAYEEPRYRVLKTLDHDIQIRSYGPLVAIETRGGADGFGRLFNYIAGANHRDQTIAMTAPVEDRGGQFGKAASGDAGTDGQAVLRFFLPRSVAADPPAPKDPRVKVVRLPARTIAAIRFSGSLDRDSIARHAALLVSTLAADGRQTTGPAYVLGYDPPFTIPFLRRNEVAIDLVPGELNRG